MIVNEMDISLNITSNIHCLIHPNSVYCNRNDNVDDNAEHGSGELQTAVKDEQCSLQGVSCCYLAECFQNLGEYVQ